MLVGTLLISVPGIPPDATAGSAAERYGYRGTVGAGPGVGADPDDRLVLKLYHPGPMVELDVRYRIITDFALPYDFVMVPSIDMSGNTRWSRYVLEVYLDRDGDVTTLNADEAFARTEEPIPLGTRGVALMLNLPR